MIAAIAIAWAAILFGCGYYVGLKTGEYRMQRACLAGEVVEIADMKLRCRPPVIESSRASHPQVIA